MQPVLAAHWSLTCTVAPHRSSSRHRARASVTAWAMEQRLADLLEELVGLEAPRHHQARARLQRRVRRDRMHAAARLTVMTGALMAGARMVGVVVLRADADRTVITGDAVRTHGPAPATSTNQTAGTVPPGDGPGAEAAAGVVNSPVRNGPAEGENGGREPRLTSAGARSEHGPRYRRHRCDRGPGGCWSGPGRCWCWCTAMC